MLITGGLEAPFWPSVGVNQIPDSFHLSESQPRVEGSASRGDGAGLDDVDRVWRRAASDPFNFGLGSTSVRVRYCPAEIQHAPVRSTMTTRS